MSPSKTTSSGPLTDRSPNKLSPTKSENTKSVLLDDKINMPRFEQPQRIAVTQDGSTQNYISPSDAIRSPTTKKLSAIKGKRIASAKPKTLFAQTLARENFRSQNQDNSLQPK